MIATIEDLPAGVIGVQVDGTVTAEEYRSVLAPLVERAAAEGGGIRFLYVMGPDFQRYTMAAMWEDARVGLGHLRSWERVACVSDAAWIAHAVGAFGWMMPGATRVFPSAELEAAREWVAA